MYQRSRHGRTILLLVAFAALLVSGMVLVASPSASAAGPECTVGVQVQSSCLIEGPAPTVGLRCSVSDSVFENQDGCFVLVRPIVSSQDCEVPYYDYPEIGVTCEYYAFEVPSGFTCPSVSTSVSQEPIIVDEIEIGIRCIAEPVLGYACPPNTAPFVEDLDFCLRSVAFTEGPICIAGFFALSGACFRYELVPTAPVLSCATDADLELEQCVRFEPRLGGSSYCPVSETVIQDGQACFVLVPENGDGQCPTGTSPHDDTDLCRQPIDLTPIYLCNENFSLYNAACLQFSDALDDGGPAPVYDCLGADSGTGICQFRIVNSQAGRTSSLGTGQTTNLRFEACVGGAAVTLILDEDGAVGAPLPLVEGPSGVFTADYLAPDVGQYLMVMSFRCGEDAPVHRIRTGLVFGEPITDTTTGYVALNPARILDTRNAVDGAFSTPWGAGETRTVQVTGNGGVPSGPVSAVAINVTTIASSDPGKVMAPFSWLSVNPTGFPVTGTAFHNFGSASATTELVNDLLIATLGATGGVDITNANGDVDVIIDVVGYFIETGGAGYVPLEADRILDTRAAPLQTGAFDTPWAAETRSLSVVGVGGVPSDNVEAVVLNITSASPTAAFSWLTVNPTGTSPSTTAALNFGTAAVTTELVNDVVIAKVGTDGKIDIANEAGSVDLIVDVVGYFTNGVSAIGYQSQSPARLLDTRNSTDGDFDTPWGPAMSRSITIDGGGCAVKAAVLHVTTVSPSAAVSWLTLTPGGVAPSQTAVHLFGTASFTSELANDIVIAKVNSGGVIDIYNQAGNVDLVIDIAGIFYETGSCVG